MIRLKPEDVQRMYEIRHEVAKAIAPFAHNTEAAIGMAACLIVAKTLLGKYKNLEARAQLQEVAVMFLKDESPDMLAFPFDIHSPGSILQ